MAEYSTINKDIWMEAIWKPSHLRTLAPHQPSSGLVELFGLDQTNGKTRRSFSLFLKVQSLKVNNTNKCLIFYGPPTGVQGITAVL